jgi:uncharacterized HAD superfamily protein
MDKWIVFDVDDVICNFRESLYQSFKDKGLDLPWQDWNHYNHVKMFNFTHEKELHLHMKEALVLEKSLLEEGVREVMTNLKQKGYKIGLLTARGWHSEGEIITQAFIDKYSLPVDKLVISGQHMDRKSAHMDKFKGEIAYYIDDSIHHIQDFLSQGVKAFLMNRPWNQDSILPRIHSLKEFEEQVQPVQPMSKTKLKM